MSKFRFLPVAVLFGVAFVVDAKAQAPTTAQFQQTLEAQLQQLKPTGYTVRTVRFEEVRPGRPNGGYYPFQVTASIHDYGPGYPVNNFYGATCLGKMEKWKFDMRKDDFGGWIVQGRMTVSDAICKDNPSAGVSAIPLASVRGSAAAAVTPAKAPPASTANPAIPYIGEWACYGFGNRIMAGMGFVLERGGRYHDVDGGRAGEYGYNAASSTISFRGGFLSGQTGKSVRTTGFKLTETVSCEPWR